MKSINEVETEILKMVHEGALPQYLAKVICTHSKEKESAIDVLDIITKGAYRKNEQYKCTNIEYRKSEMQLWKNDFY